SVGNSATIAARPATTTPPTYVRAATDGSARFQELNTLWAAPHHRLTTRIAAARTPHDRVAIVSTPDNRIAIFGTPHDGTTFPTRCLGGEPRNRAIRAVAPRAPDDIARRRRGAPRRPAVSVAIRHADRA